MQSKTNNKQMGKSTALAEAKVIHPPTRAITLSPAEQSNKREIIHFRIDASCEIKMS
jgi:hypothetical protein